jgi:hypothetical protein
VRKLFTVAAVGAATALGTTMVMAQAGGQETVSRSYDLSGFEEISVVGPHHVVISVGPAYSLRIDAPQQTFDDTEVEVEDGRLKIHPVEDDRWQRRWSEQETRDYWASYKPATIHVTLPELAVVSLVGGGDMRVDRVERGEFSATVAGSGDLVVAELRVEQARFAIAGSGDLAARGSARRSRVSIAGSGNLQAREVTSDDASISIVGSGNVVLTVENDARISMVGGGDVDIAGPARCSVSRMGGGRVRCGGDNVAG